MTFLVTWGMSSDMKYYSFFSTKLQLFSVNLFLLIGPDGIHKQVIK